MRIRCGWWIGDRDDRSQTVVVFAICQTNSIMKTKTTIVILPLLLLTLIGCGSDLDHPVISAEEAKQIAIREFDEQLGEDAHLEYDIAMSCSGVYWNVGFASPEIIFGMTIKKATGEIVMFIHGHPLPRPEL